MDTNGAQASTAPGEQEPSPPEALRHLQQQIEELQAYFTHFVSAKIDGFLLSGRQIALWIVLGIMGLLALAGLVITAIVQLLSGAAVGFGLLCGGRLWLGQVIVGGGLLLLLALSIFDVYRFWHHLENYPRFMKHLELVVSIGETRSHWVARGPRHMPLIWDTELVEERENTLLSWRSLSGSDVDTMGTVCFRELPHGRGTEVRLKLAYALPDGMTGVALAQFLKTLTVRQLKKELRHCKQIIESGETPLITN